SLLLAPLSLLYAGVISVRRLAYRQGWLRSTRVAVPVLVVGNITVGGSGKTPLTAYIARELGRRGLHVGIISRGYGGRSEHYPLHVTGDSDATLVGDEPLLLAQRGAATVVVDPVRARGAQWLVEYHGVDVIVADDGLQHYALARDAEIAVVDGGRGYGNGWLLPAGPLREPQSRLRTVDLQLVQAANGDFTLLPDAVRPLSVDAETGQGRDLDTFAGQSVHAIAAIGAPARFFALLRAHGIDVIEHAFADHHAFSADDILFADQHPVLMTEKDAVKCRAWADHRHYYVPVNAHFKAASEQRLHAMLERLATPIRISRG